jgi:hypothetical protein
MPESDYTPRTEPSGTFTVSGNNIAFGTVVEVVMAGTLGPLVTAFCTELGKRLGGNAADWASRMRLIHKGNNSNKAVLLVHAGAITTVIEVNEDLSDEARLALLVLDVENDANRGQRLRWNAQVGAWLPKDKTEQPLRQQPQRQSRSKRSGRH